MTLPIITPRNFTQKFNDQTRGGLYTVIGSGGVTEAAISTGSLLNYTVPSGKKTKMNGSLLVTNLGSNTTISVNVFDNSAGRIIPVAITAVVNTKVQFEFVLFNDDFTVTISGDNAANDGAAAVIVSLEELPA